MGLAAAGWRLGWLTGGGAVAAVFVGAAVFWAGPGPAVALGVFFVSGSALTSVNRRAGKTSDDSERGGRTARQVFANGGVAALGALLTHVAPEAGWCVVLGSLSAAQADTWATEIGARARQRPRLITTLRPVPAGTSGGMTGLGTTSGVAGATVLAISGFLVGAPHALAAFVGGVAGLLIDSLLGATVQGRFYCDGCGQETERRVHRCGARTRCRRGLGWLDNDAVNAGATLAGAGISLALSPWF
jgi:uncharacterized protein (TIGR00297 family)